MITSQNFVMVDKNIIREFLGDFNILAQLYLYIEAYNMYYVSNKLQDDGSFYISIAITQERLNLSRGTIIKNKKILEDRGYISTKVKEAGGVSYIYLNIDKISKVQRKDYNLSTIKTFEEEVKDEEVLEAKPNLPIVSEESYGKKLVVSWNAIAEKYNLNKIIQCKEDRIRKFKSIMKLVGLNEKELFLGIANAIATSSFLRGDNSNSWKCGFDFFLQKKSIQKALEGQYSDNKKLNKADIKQEEFNKMASSFLQDDKTIIF